METRIAARLRDQLGTAKSANEMFRIFSRYNALFVRAHIRGAIREYQTQLIQRVKDDIESLHNKFKVWWCSAHGCQTLQLNEFVSSILPHVLPDFSCHLELQFTIQQNLILENLILEIELCVLIGVLEMHAACFK